MIIYQITNKINNKNYVGQTIRSMHKRLIEHKKAANSNIKSPLYCSIRKYGIENFCIKQIDEANSIEELNEKEIYWIKELNTLIPTGYNLREGGNQGGSLHPSQIEYLRKINTGKKHSEETKEKCRQASLGRQFSEEHNEKIRQANLGVKHSKDRIQKNKDWHINYYANGGKHAKGMLGKGHSEETRKRMCEDRKKRWQDPEFREMMLSRRRKANVKY